MSFNNDRSYAQYFNDISTARMPANAQEEQDLFHRYHQHGDQDARRRIIEGGLRFVIKTAKQYYRGDSEFLKNLIAAGNVGLVTAVDRYRPWVIKCTCGKHNYVLTPKHQRCSQCQQRLQHTKAERYTTRFLTYAAWWISEAIRTELYESSLVHIPPYKQKEYHRARQEGHTVGFSYISFDDVLDHDQKCGDETLHRYDKLMQQALEATASDHEYETLAQHAINLLHALLQSMKDRSAYVLIAYYGLREEAKTLREIAQKLGVCPERVRQIKEDALQELKTKLIRLRIQRTSDVFVS